MFYLYFWWNQIKGENTKCIGASGIYERTETFIKKILRTTCGARRSAIRTTKWENVIFHPTY